MNAKQRALLTLDGIVNLILGSLLLFFPAGLAAWLGLPETRSYFYASILGAVLVGIGLALMLERYGTSWEMRGLGLHGAIAINLCGGVRFSSGWRARLWMSRPAGGFFCGRWAGSSW